MIRWLFVRPKISALSFSISAQNGLNALANSFVEVWREFT